MGTKLLVGTRLPPPPPQPPPPPSSRRLPLKRPCAALVLTTGFALAELAMSHPPKAVVAAAEAERERASKRAVAWLAEGPPLPPAPQLPFQESASLFTPSQPPLRSVSPQGLLFRRPPALQSTPPPPGPLTGKGANAALLLPAAGPSAAAFGLQPPAARSARFTPLYSECRAAARAARERGGRRGEGERNTARRSEKSSSSSPPPAPSACMASMERLETAGLTPTVAEVGAIKTERGASAY